MSSGHKSRHNCLLVKVVWLNFLKTPDTLSSRSRCHDHLGRVLRRLRGRPLPPKYRSNCSLVLSSSSIIWLRCLLYFQRSTFSAQHQTKLHSYLLQLSISDCLDSLGPGTRTRSSGPAFMIPSKVISDDTYFTGVSQCEWRGTCGHHLE